MATSDVWISLSAETIAFIACIWATQKGHQRPRIKETTSLPVARRSAERTILPFWSGNSNAGARLPDGLNFSRNILGDPLLAFVVDLAQGVRLWLQSRFFERAPFHGESEFYAHQGCGLLAGQRRMSTCNAPGKSFNKTFLFHFAKVVENSVLPRNFRNRVPGMMLFL